MQQIGLLGGTFDPIHNGHLAIAEEVRWQLKLDQILFIPAGQQPLKTHGHCASPLERLAMTRLAIHGNPAFDVCAVEVDRPGPSFTVDTVVTLQHTFPEAELLFIIGADALASLHRWHAIGRLVELCRFVVVGRPGWAGQPTTAEHLPPTTRLVFVEGPLLPISATELRTRLQSNLPIRYQVPEAVYHYIVEHQLYGTCA